MTDIPRITLDPAVMGGKPCIRGLRVTVGIIIGLLAAGSTQEEILAAYPYLEPADIQAALHTPFGELKSARSLCRSHERQNPDRHEPVAGMGNAVRGSGLGRNALV